MEFPDHFSVAAEGYAAARPSYPAELIDVLAELAPRTELAWDAGCGSGQLSVPLAGRFERVVATDASAAQLARADPHPRVEYRQAYSEASGLAPGSVDLAVAGQAAHWFDLRGYYAEVRRVAVPGAVIALVTYGGTRIGPEIDRLVERFRRETLAPRWPPQRIHVEAGYASLPFPFDEIDVPPVEIRVTWDADDFLAYVRTWSALRATEREEGLEEAAVLVAELGSELSPIWREPRVVIWPLTVRAGRIG